jgi:uncharacterized repeat protein (TIGR01451 family)
MKKLVAVTLLGLSAIACVAAADAAVIVNTCTSTYVAYNFPTVYASGWDSVAISTETPPNIAVTKYVKNLRSGVESNYMVPCLAGDTVEFRITWANIGSGTADTVTLTDYIPSGMTFVGGSLTNAETNCGSANSSESSGTILYVITAVPGTSAGPNYGFGEMKFRATIN